MIYKFIAIIVWLALLIGGCAAIGPSTEASDRENASLPLVR